MGIESLGASVELWRETAPNSGQYEPHAAESVTYQDGERSKSNDEMIPLSLDQRSRVVIIGSAERLDERIVSSESVDEETIVVVKDADISPVVVTNNSDRLDYPNKPVAVSDTRALVRHGLTQVGVEIDKNLVSEGYRSSGPLSIGRDRMGRNLAIKVAVFDLDDPRSPSEHLQRMKPAGVIIVHASRVPSSSDTISRN